MSAASTHLAVLSQASRLLARATSIDEIKTVRDKAEAVRSYIQAARMGLEAQNDAAELKLRAERKAGALLGAMRMRGGNRKSKSPRVTLKLEALGISRNQSVRWQRLAAISDAQLDAYLVAMRGDGHEITSAGLLRAGCKKCQRTERPTNGVVSSNGHTTKWNPEATFAELSNHCQLLHDILKPSCDGATSELTPSDRRIADRLVADIAKLAAHVEKSIPPTICKGCERYLP